jgi:hypothetical protein
LFVERLTPSKLHRSEPRLTVPPCRFTLLAHCEDLQALGNGAVRVIDKMPDNTLFLWLIAALFPSARIILCRRDLRDACLSCYFHRFTEGHLYACD